MFSPDRISEEARGGNRVCATDEDDLANISTLKGLLENANFDLETKDFSSICTESLGKSRHFDVHE